MSKSTKKLYKDKWTFDEIPDLSDKVMIVTGSNRGLGFVVATQLARHNAQVIMAVRNVDHGEIAKKEILSTYPDAKLDVLQLDLANLGSIQSFTTALKQNYSQIDVLLNNAGITSSVKIPAHAMTDDGFEYFFGVNHLGTYALTGSLFDVLRQTPDSRVVTVSSLSHRQAKMHFDDVMFEKKYSRGKIYGQSKLANLLFGYELSRLIQRNNLTMESIVVHPGFAKSSKKKQGFLVELGKKLLAQSAEQGALPLLYGMVGPEVENGDFIGPNGFMGIKGFPKRVTSSQRSYNEEDALKVWQMSQELTKVSFPVN